MVVSEETPACNDQEMKPKPNFPKEEIVAL